MIQKVLKVGSSAAITIPKKALKELNIKIGDEVRVDITPNNQVIVKPIHLPTNRQKRMAKNALDFIERYRDDLEALADK